MPIYTQRWLREHQAVPTELGWKRHNSNEMLKMQKGLATSQPEQPVFISSTMKNIVSIAKVDPETFISRFTFDYIINEPEYEPILIEPICRDNVVSFDYEIDREKRQITCIGKDITVDGRNVWMQLYVEGRLCTNLYNSVYFSIDYKNPTINKVSIYGGSQYVYINNGGKGRTNYGYRVYDTILTYEKEDVEVFVEYEGKGIITPSVIRWSSVGNLIYIDVEGDVEEGEQFYSYVQVKGVKSTKFKHTITFNRNNQTKLFDEMTDEEKDEYHSNM